MNLPIGFVFDSGKNITPNWHTTASKLLSGNGRVAGGQISLCSPGNSAILCPAVTARFARCDIAVATDIAATFW
jgi:hypothetical protein